MVYNGPSKGCRRCRQRKIKCDQRSPRCVNCSTRGNTCPGYHDIFDKAHRDETVKVSKRHSQKSSTASSPSISSILQTNLMQLYPRIPPGLTPSAEYEALGFFFLRYSVRHDVDSTCDLFSILPGMYTQSKACSPLAKATTALALQVTHLHYSRGAESAMGYRMYAEAVTSTRKALTALSHSNSDDLLMTTLVLQTFESANATFGGRRDCASRSLTHLLGSIALLKQRGHLNYRDELSWRLFLATRNRLLRFPWRIDEEMDAVEVLGDIWNCGAGNQPRGPAVAADSLALRLSLLKLQARATSITDVGQPKEKARTLDRHVDYEELDNIIARCIRLVIECTHWQYSLPSAWRPVYVPASTIDISEQAAGIYEHTAPSIYTDIYIANSVNRHRITELGCLSLIDACLAASSVPAERIRGRPRGLHKLPPWLFSRAQILIDEICASLPFLIGIVATVPSRATTILTPSATRAYSAGGVGDCMPPRNMIEHAQQVESSGLYMMYGTLMTLLGILEDGFTENVVRDGQVKWILGQAHRLRRILHVVH